MPAPSVPSDACTGLAPKQPPETPVAPIIDLIATEPIKMSSAVPSSCGHMGNYLTAMRPPGPGKSSHRHQGLIITHSDGHKWLATAALDM